jgi:toxin ParE1/3/4
LEVWRHPKANEDLLDIWLFIARRNIEAADGIVESIEDKFRLLSDYPEIGRPRPEIGPGVRSVAVGNYLVLYRSMTGRVEIVRVIHGARHLKGLLR